MKKLSGNKCVYMVQKGKKFYVYKVDVRGLSRKQAAKKRNEEYKQWRIYRNRKNVYSDITDAYKEEISSSEKTYVKKYNKISSTSEPVKDGKSTYHRPRRNYWGNLDERDTYKEGYYKKTNYDHSNFDSENDHDHFYRNDSLWK